MLTLEPRFAAVSAPAIYRADYDYRDKNSRVIAGGKWKPSIFMPRAACRIVLEVVAVRLERLQEISAADCAAEGVRGDRIQLAGDAAYVFGRTYDFPKGDKPTCGEVLRAGYRGLWDSINGKRPGCAWADDPWVWVVEFRRLET